MHRRLDTGVELRDASSDADYAAVVDLQRATWGDGFNDAVPPPMLKISQKMGGVVAGAFDQGGRMLGFIYGMSGFRFGQRAHWSHMLAVARDARGLGLGRELKAFQRELLLLHRVETVYWTYDPLVSRNANLNLNRLGALPLEYVENMYGEDTGSLLHSGLGTDRFIVAWAIGSEGVGRLMARGATRGPTRDTPPFPVDKALPRTAWVEIPPDIGSILRFSPDDASAWRRHTRARFQALLGAGYAVTGFTWTEDLAADADGPPAAPEARGRRYYYRLEARRHPGRPEPGGTQPR